MHIRYQVLEFFGIILLSIKLFRRCDTTKADTGPFTQERRKDSSLPVGYYLCRDKTTFQDSWEVFYLHLHWIRERNIDKDGFFCKNSRD